MLAKALKYSTKHCIKLCIPLRRFSYKYLTMNNYNWLLNHAKYLSKLVKSP